MPAARPNGKSSVTTTGAADDTTAATPTTAAAAQETTALSSVAATTASAGSTLQEIPEETAGPYPGDGSNGVNVLAAQVEGADSKTLRETLDKLKDKLKSAAIVLSAVADGKVTLIAGVTADVTAKVKAGELVNFVALQVGGKGGGRADMAQAGGTQPDKLAAALASVPAWVRDRI